MTIQELIERQSYDSMYQCVRDWEEFEKTSILGEKSRLRNLATTYIIANNLTTTVFAVSRDLMFEIYRTLCGQFTEVDIS